MKDKKAHHIATAVCSALAIATAANDVFAQGYYDAAKKRCYGAARAGQNDCPSSARDGGHSCKGTAVTDCDINDWKTAKSAEKCKKLIAKNCPKNAR